MLFTVNSDDMLKDYFNLENSKTFGDYNYNSNNKILSPKEALILGNSFINEYDAYKNYKPREIKISSEQDKELLKIRELSFIVNDLNLILDTEPNNREYFNLFKKYTEELNERIKRYSEKYDVLELCYDTKDKYTWYENPWPWEVDKYV